MNGSYCQMRRRNKGEGESKVWYKKRGEKGGKAKGGDVK